MAAKFIAIEQIENVVSTSANSPFVLFALIAAIVILSLSKFFPKNKAYAKRNNVVSFDKHANPQKASKTPSTQAQPSLQDPKNQMDAISMVGFETCRLLNKEEAKVLPVLENVIKSLGRGHRVMAQTSLGELLKPKASKQDQNIKNRAFASINSKRLDFAIINKFGHLVCAVEYQGTGHYQQRSFMRDAVKREVLRKAGVPLLEVKPEFKPDELSNQLRIELNPN